MRVKKVKKKRVFNDLKKDYKEKENFFCKKEKVYAIRFFQRGKKKVRCPKRGWCEMRYGECLYEED